MSKLFALSVTFMSEITYTLINPGPFPPNLENCAASSSRTSKRATAVLSLVTKLFCANLTKALKSVLYPLMSIR